MLFQKIFLSLLESRLKDRKRILPATPNFKRRCPGVLRVATVQIDYIRLSGIVEFSLFINQYLQKMSNFSPDLIVFPSLMDYLLLGTFPINLFSKNKRKLLKDMKFCLHPLNRSVVEYMKMISQMWKCGVVFGTSQGVTGFLNGFETERIFETNNVKVLIASKQSTRNSFYLRKHTDAGVTVVAVPSVGIPSYDDWSEKIGIWGHSQLLGFYGLRATMSGSFFNMKFRDAAEITAPIPLTEKLDGYIAKNTDTSEDAVLLAELDIDRLSKYIASQKMNSSKYRLFLKNT